MSNTTIGFIGFGFVGQAVYSALKESGRAFIYDKNNPKFSDKASVVDCEYIFVCVPTPTDKNGNQDLSAFKETMEWLSEEEYQGVVIIKSTVMPEAILEWESMLNLVANPEFLTQNFAAHDFEYQNLVLLGGNAADCCDVREMYAEEFHLPNAEYHLTSIEEAMMFKYIHNAYHAYNVLFWNYVQEVHGNARKHANLYQMLYNRIPIMSQVAADGRLGYGGACFPKDMKALNFYHPHDLTKFMNNYNKKLRGE